MATAPAVVAPAPQGSTVFWNVGKLDFSLTSSGLAVTGKSNSRQSVAEFAKKLIALAALLPDEDEADDEAE